MTTLHSSIPPTPGTHPATRGAAGDGSLGAHLRTCSAPHSLASFVLRSLEWLHGLTAPRLVSTWFTVLLIATLLALAF